MRILLAGSGSGGPVVPVLAVAKKIRELKSQTEFLFIGSKKGPERDLVAVANIPFRTIPAAKLRRYLSIWNLIDVSIFIYSLIKSFFIIKKFKPDVIFSAGGFIAVPVSWVGKLMGAKIVIHQQDASPGLANRMIAPVAHKITATFEATAKQFYTGTGLFRAKLKPGAEWVGNPVRPEIFADKKPNRVFFGLDDQLPVLLITGGATGSEQINKITEEALPAIVKSHQVIHVYGRGKYKPSFKHEHYHTYEFLGDEMVDALKISDIVVSRAGLSTIAELSALRKVAIIIPMSHTHQEANGFILKLTASAVVLFREEATGENLACIVNALKFDPARVKLLSENIYKLMPKDAAEKIAQIIIKEAGK